MSYVSYARTATNSRRNFDYICAKQRYDDATYKVSYAYSRGSRMRGAERYEMFDAVRITEKAMMEAETALLADIGEFTVTPDGPKEARLKAARAAWDNAMLTLKAAVEAEELALDAYFDAADQAANDDELTLARVKVNAVEARTENIGVLVHNCFKAYLKALVG